MSNGVEDILALLNADDIANVSDSVRNQQAQINVLSQFCSDTGLVINFSKTKIMVIRIGGILRSTERWYFQGKLLDSVSVYKYMGLLANP